jgi:hypothetical protein
MPWLPLELLLPALLPGLFEHDWRIDIIDEKIKYNKR